MTLYMIGLGLDYKDISVKALEIVRECKVLYVENYTSVQLDKSKLERLFKKEIILADRDMVESKAEETILKGAKKGTVGFLVMGDVFSATTHSDLFLRAKKLGIKTYILHGSSIISAVGITGLQLYKFGKIVSIPFDRNVDSFYDVLKMNKENGLHSLILLDLDSKNERYMSANEGIKILRDVEKKRKEGLFLDDSKAIVCVRLGSLEPVIVYDEVKNLVKRKFGKGPHCLVIPGKLHYMEEDVLELYQKDL